MRAAWRIAAVVALALSAMTLSACKSSEEGVKTDKFRQWTTVNASTEKTTAAAKEVLGDMKLKDVSAKSTAIDGEAKGTMADGTVVNVSVAKKGDGSEVTVRVGTMGDSKLGAQIASDIKKEAESK